MIDITGTTISMTRGDSLSVTIVMKDATGQPYTPAEGDVIRFALKSAEFTLGRKAFKDTDPLITKVIPNDTLVLALAPADTKQLNFGDYIYDIQLTHADGTVDTFIYEAKFVIRPEVS